MCKLQWLLATLVSMSTNECQNIASAIIINFEKCNITLLQTKILTQSDIDQQTIKRRLDEIRMQSRSTQYTHAQQFNNSIQTAPFKPTEYKNSVQNTVNYVDLLLSTNHSTCHANFDFDLIFKYMYSILY